MGAAIAGAAIGGGAAYMATDPNAAAAAGFAKPIWAGTQGMVMVLEHLQRLGGSREVESTHLLVRFRRAALWDDTLELWFRQAAGRAAGVGDFVLWRHRDGKTVLELEVKELRRTAARV